MGARWKNLFTCMVAGPTGCGNTTFVTRMFRHAATIINPPSDKITWCYGEWQPAYDDLPDGVRLHEGLPDESSFKDATSPPIISLFIKPETMRLRTCIFPNDDLQYVYLPKVYRDSACASTLH